MSLSEKQENHYGSIIDNLDNRFEQKKEKLLIDINNTRRSKEINKYYTLKYNSYATIFLYLTIITIIYLFLRYIEMLQLIPSFITTTLMLLIATLGILYIIYLSQDIGRRSNFNFNKYNFIFKDSDKNNNDRSQNSSMFGSCRGADCCPYGTTYDIHENVCKI
jgi:hypothetical protein